MRRSYYSLLSNLRDGAPPFVKLFVKMHTVAHMYYAFKFNSYQYQSQSQYMFRHYRCPGSRYVQHICSNIIYMNNYAK